MHVRRRDNEKDMRIMIVDEDGNECIHESVQHIAVELERGDVFKPDLRLVEDRLKSFES